MWSTPATTSVKIRLLFLQIVSDLNRTHAVRDEQNIFGADPFFFKPAKQFIRYALIGPLFKLQPCQSSVSPLSAADGGIWGRLIPMLESVASHLDRVSVPAQNHNVQSILLSASASLLPNLLHLRHPLPNSQILFRISHRMGAYPLHKASAEQLLLFHAGKALAIDPACLIATVTIVAGITGNPACFPLAIHAPIVRAYFSTAVINRTAKLMPVRLSRGQTVFPVSPLCPEFTENKAILAPLNQISIVLFCPNIPGAPRALNTMGCRQQAQRPFLL